MSDVRRGAIEENKKLWEQWTRINVASDLYEVDAFKEGRERTAGERAAAAGVRLRDYELEEIGDVRGRSVLHLMCHFGIDTLSFARLGADRHPRTEHSSEERMGGGDGSLLPWIVSLL